MRKKEKFLLMNELIIFFLFCIDENRNPLTTCIGDILYL